MYAAIYCSLVLLVKPEMRETQTPSNTVIDTQMWVHLSHVSVNPMSVHSYSVGVLTCARASTMSPKCRDTPHGVPVPLSQAQVPSVPLLSAVRCPLSICPTKALAGSYMALLLMFPPSPSVLYYPALSSLLGATKVLSWTHVVLVKSQSKVIG